MSRRVIKFFRPLFDLLVWSELLVLLMLLAAFAAGKL